MLCTQTVISWILTCYCAWPLHWLWPWPVWTYGIDILMQFINMLGPVTHWRPLYTPATGTLGNACTTRVDVWTNCLRGTKSWCWPRLPTLTPRQMSRGNKKKCCYKTHQTHTGALVGHQWKAGLENQSGDTSSVSHLFWFVWAVQSRALKSHPRPAKAFTTPKQPRDQLIRVQSGSKVQGQPTLKHTLYLQALRIADSQLQNHCNNK